MSSEVTSPTPSLRPTPLPELRGYAGGSLTFAAPDAPLVLKIPLKGLSGRVFRFLVGFYSLSG